MIFAARLPRHQLDSLHDLLVPSASAQIARYRLAYLVPVRVRVSVEQSFGRHQHARSAEPALNCSVLNKGPLQDVHLPILGQPFDCHDLSPVALSRQHQA